MIKGIMGSKGVNVQGGNTSLQYVSQNTSNPMQGMIRVWGTDLQVFDGSNWQNIMSSYATVELDGETQSLLQWIRDKQKEEREIEALSNDHPAVRIAKENLNKVKAKMERAEQQLKATVILSKEYENNEATAS
jgi:hypothetical protein